MQQPREVNAKNLMGNQQLDLRVGVRPLQRRDITYLDWLYTEPHSSETYFICLLAIRICILSILFHLLNFLSGDQYSPLAIGTLPI